MRPVFFLLACLALMPSAAPARELACTQMGCESGLLLAVPPDTAWLPGDYRFTVTMDGVEVACRGALPLKPCETPSLACSGEGVGVTESGCALPAEAQGFGDIRVVGAPANVHVRIARNGVTLTDQSFVPAYRTFRPNGPHCEPVCTQATERLSLK